MLPLSVIKSLVPGHARGHDLSVTELLGKTGSSWKFQIGVLHTAPVSPIPFKPLVADLLNPSCPYLLGRKPGHKHPAQQPDYTVNWGQGLRVEVEIRTGAQGQDLGPHLIIGGSSVVKRRNSPRILFSRDHGSSVCCIPPTTAFGKSQGERLLCWVRGSSRLARPLLNNQELRSS